MSAYTPKYAPPAVMPRRLHATADMNIAPMIDVLLVLLVLFMAALPLSQQGLDATVPAETQRSAGPLITSQIVVEYSAARRISLNREDLTLGQLRDRLRDVFAGRRDKTLYLMGDGHAAAVAVQEDGPGGMSRAGPFDASRAPGPEPRLDP